MTTRQLNLHALGVIPDLINSKNDTILLNITSPVTNDPTVTPFYYAGDMLIRKDWYIGVTPNHYYGNTAMTASTVSSKVSTSVTLGSSGTVTLGSSGTATLGSSGTATLGSSGTATLGSSGTATLGSSGTATLGASGTSGTPVATPTLDFLGTYTGGFLISWYVHQQLAAKHFTYNNAQVIDAAAIDSGGKIVKQSLMNNFKFGALTMNDNGCGVIASYNVSLILGETPESIAQIVKYYEERSGGAFSGMFAEGYLGTWPWSVSTYLKDIRGYTVDDQPIDSAAPSTKANRDAIGVKDFEIAIYDNVEFAIIEWNQRASNCDCGVIMYLSSNINYAHFVAYEKKGTVDSLNEPEYIFYNDTVRSLAVGKTSTNVGTARDFIKQAILPIYHTAIKK